MVMMKVVGAHLSSAILRREFSAAAAPTAAPPLISPEDQGQDPADPKIYRHHCEPAYGLLLMMLWPEAEKTAGKFFEDSSAGILYQHIQKMNFRPHNGNTQ